jgi:hypothetical protein
MSYAQLSRHLALQTTSEVLVSFEEVERVLGRPLPESAVKHQAWWANTRSHSHAHAWLDAGWKTARLNLANRRVTFVRDPGRPRFEQTAPKLPALETKGMPEDTITLPLSALSNVAKRMLDREAEAAGGDRLEAVARLLHVGATARIMAEMDRYRVMSKPGTDSVDLIREDRDAR